MKRRFVAIVVVRNFAACRTRIVVLQSKLEFVKYQN